MKRKINPNFSHLVKSIREGYSGAQLEGSSRSQKTWSSIDFIIYLCTRIETNCKFIITRETFNSFKTTLYEDFNRRLPMFGISSPFAEVENVTRFNLFGSTIHLMGADTPIKFEGAGSDYFWMNEILDQPKSVFDQLEQRCRKFWWCDYNPKAYQHWVYDSLNNRPDINFLHTTFKDNPNISIPERRKILSYEPTTENIKNGTADEYRWNVYGLGLRSSREGVIFKNWKEGEFNDTLPYGYGLDFGSRDPDAMVKVAIDRANKKIYVKELIYQNELSTGQLFELINKVTETGKLIVADSAGTRTIQDLKGGKLNVIPVVKTPIVDGIRLMQDYELIISPESVNLKNELRDYVWLEKKGEIPSDVNNHLIDSLRYYVTTIIKPQPLFKGHKTLHY